ncbi:hypothetical protein PTTG_29703 [Puccinia triticina 1-1 BBBD Race 1]|uniref:MPN domain-containing protein n=1 Tax=Puccinia triticina (isolate 1-1 / race 1 (BBBD)) TaxID=630390 RepID=A0A0C4F8Q9_PUCT1|nr:hypothetical protein PTTG_29703 [Puccinia triticina 1-1 BBBD Race 1]
MSVARSLDPPQPQSSSSSRPDPPPRTATAGTTFRHPALYDLPDPIPSPTLDRPSASSGGPTSPKKPVSHPLTFARFARSSDALPASEGPSRASAPPPLSSSFRNLLRPRRLSWTAASSKPAARRDSLTDWAPIDIPCSPTAPSHPQPQRPPPPPTTTTVAGHTRSRKGSLGEPSSWRWLRNLKLSPPVPTPTAPVSAAIYADIPATSPLYSVPPSRTQSATKGTDHGRRRPMTCPADLVGAFIAMAEPETAKGIELCGLLLGSLKGGKLVVDTLLIPKQRSTADTCHTVDEAATFAFQSRAGLMTLGWIHTHPTQTCFMSSVDLHNHLSYQLMLPEAVAIVCSPFKQPSVGVYTLTEPHGLHTIRSCVMKPDAFHPHPQDDDPARPIYTTPDARLFAFGGQDQRMDLDIVDLR